MAMILSTDPLLTSSIIKLPSETIAIFGVLISMLNLTKIQKPDVYLALSLVAHYLILRDFGPDIKFSGSIHSIMCHGHMYIKYAQEELGIPLGFLTENASEMGNQQNKEYKHMFSRKISVVKATEDMFKRRLYISDPILFIDEEMRQIIKRGKVYRKG